MKMLSKRSMKLGSARQQRGAVLYIALIMLILLALIGIVGMQVSTLQERMSANYRATNIAFQNAEGLARNSECALEDIVNKTSTTGCDAIVASDIDLVCDNGFDAGQWSAGRTLTAGAAVNARLIGPCIAGYTDIAMGGPISEDPNPIYEITAYQTNGANASAAATIDTIFRP